MNVPPGEEFSAYPRPQGTHSGIRPLPPGAHLEAISEAWRLFQREWGTWVLATLVGGLCFAVAYVVMVGTLFAFGAITPTGDLTSSGPDLAIIIVFPILYVLFLTVGLAVHYGLVNMALKQIRGQPISVGDVFGAVRRLPSLVAVTFISGLLTIVGFVLCIVPGLWMVGGLSLAPFIVLDQRKGSIEALTMSFNRAGAFATALTMFGVLFVIGFLTGVGELACFVGLLVTVPLGIIATAIEYYYFFPEQFAPIPAPQ